VLSAFQLVAMGHLWGAAVTLLGAVIVWRFGVRRMIVLLATGDLLTLPLLWIYHGVSIGEPAIAVFASVFGYSLGVVLLVASLGRLRVDAGCGPARGRWRLRLQVLVGIACIVLAGPWFALVLWVLHTPIGVSVPAACIVAVIVGAEVACLMQVIVQFAERPPRGRAGR